MAETTSQFITPRKFPNRRVRVTPYARLLALGLAIEEVLGRLPQTDHRIETQALQCGT